MFKEIVTLYVYAPPNGLNFVSDVSVQKDSIEEMSEQVERIVDESFILL